MTCAHVSCNSDPTVTATFPHAPGETREYCDQHVRHLLEMGVFFRATFSGDGDD